MLGACQVVFKSVDHLDPFDFQNDYFNGDASLGNCWVSSALFDNSTKTRNSLVNKLNIIIYSNYLKEI